MSSSPYSGHSVIVIGGGAAGFFAAIRCAELYPHLRVILLERGKELLGKVKISGGGRCNATHACFVPKDLVKSYPRGSRELLGPFTRFACGDTMEWFERRGVPLKIEDDGRVFPVSDNSQSIIDCLFQSAQRAGVNVWTNYRLDKIIPPVQEGASWRMETSGGVLEADGILVATGSNNRMWEQLQELGHTIVPPVPSLFTFNIRDERIASLPGLSVPAAELEIPGTRLSASGPLLITHWGMSGPAILRLSAWGARDLAQRDYTFTLKVNWLGLPPESVEDAFDQLRTENGKRQIGTHPQFELPTRLWRSLCHAASPEIDALRWGDLNKTLRRNLIAQLTGGEFEVKGKSTFKEEFVTAGGVDLREVNFKTFESKLHPGLFFAGEVLDIDAITGGFNFQAAWTGGWIAGEAMGEIIGLRP